MDERRGPDIGEVVDKLTRNIDNLVAELLPGGHRRGREYVIGSLAGEPGESLSICMSGAKAGVWADFAAPGRPAGDALDLVAGVLFNNDKKRAYSWAVSWLRLDDLDPGRLRQKRQAVPKKTEQDLQAEAAKEAKRAFSNWLQAEASILQTPVDHYLAHRGIDLRRLGRQPGSLRFHPEMYDGESRQKWPAMAAVIVGGDGRPLGVHRTFLKKYPRVWNKAPLEKAKKVLGPVKGGTIRLWRGERVDPETGEIKPGKRIGDMAPGEATVILTEGIEDALSIVLADPSRMVWCGSSLNYYDGLQLPPQVGTLILAGQNDEPGSEAAQAFQAACDALSGRPFDLKTSFPPSEYKDWNDWLRGKEKKHQPTEAKKPSAVPMRHIEPEKVY